MERIERTQCRGEGGAAVAPRVPAFASPLDLMDVACDATPTGAHCGLVMNPFQAAAGLQASAQGSSARFSAACRGAGAAAAGAAPEDKHQGGFKECSGRSRTRRWRMCMHAAHRVGSWASRRTAIGHAAAAGGPLDPRTSPGRGAGGGRPRQPLPARPGPASPHGRSSCCSSPLPTICSTMSAPPTNSPPT